MVAAIHESEAAGDLYAAQNAHPLHAESRGGLDLAAGLMAADEAIVFCAARGVPGERVERDRLEMLVRAGRWDEASDVAGRLLEWGADHGDLMVELGARSALAAVALGRAEPTGPLDELSTLGRSVGQPVASSAILVATAALVGGDPRAALEALEEAVDEAPANSIDDLSVFVRLALRAGSKTLARRAFALEARSVRARIDLG